MRFPRGLTLGQVTFWETKSGEPRTLPLHPEVARMLKLVMTENPEDEDAVAASVAAPIFHGQSAKAPMKRYSYRGAWNIARDAVLESSPN